MWPFGKSKSDLAWEQEFSAISAFKPVGQRLNYLGLDCVVIGHGEFCPVNGWLPRLVFEYVDSHGVLRNHSIKASQLVAMVEGKTIN